MVPTIAAVLLIAGGLTTAQPVALLLGWVLAVGVLLARRLPFDLALPGSVAILTSTAIAVGLLADLAGIDLLDSPGVTVASLLLCVSVLVVTAVAQPQTSPQLPTGVLLAAAAPATVAAVVGVAQSVDTALPLAWALDGSDITGHMGVLAHLQESGRLDYAWSGYPQGLHMLLALFSGPSMPPRSSPELLDYDLKLVATATWLSLALMLWSGSCLAARLTKVCQLPERTAWLSAGGFGLAVLFSTSFVELFVYLGAVPSLLAVTMLWLVPHLLLARPTSWPTLAIPSTAVSSMVVAHLWQPLVIVAPLAAAVTAAAVPPKTAARTLRALLASSGRRLAGMVLLTLAAVMAAAVALVGVQQKGGVSIAAIPGDAPTPPLTITAMALVAAVALTAHWANPAVRTLIGSAIGGLVVAVVMLAGAGGGLDLSQYYPMKAVWFLTLMLGPVLAAGVVWAVHRLSRPAWTWLGQRGDLGRLGRAVLVAATIAAVIGLGLPRLLGPASATMRVLSGLYSTPAERLSVTSGAERRALALTYGTKFSPAATVPVAVGSSALFDRKASNIVSRLISFRTDQPQTSGNPEWVCKDLAQFPPRTDVVVITKLPTSLLQDLIAEQGCGPVRIVQIPGGIRDTWTLTNGRR